MKSWKKKIITGSAIAFVAIAVPVAVMTASQPSNLTAAASVFEVKSGVTIAENYTLDASLGLNDARSGVLLSSSVSGAEVALAGDFCGTFEMDFRVVSDVNFVQSGDVTGDTIANSAMELREMQLHFSETESGQSFDVIINGGSNMNFATPQASVSFDGQRRGVFLYNYKDTLRADSANTTQANGAGRYTALYGTSFSNTAYVNDATLADSVSSTTIGFDPYTMEVYYLTDTGAKTVIWNMSKTETDGQIASVLSPFSKYKVSLEFTDIAFDKTADMVVYSINGQDMSGATLANKIGPNVNAQYAVNAVKNNKFAVEKPVTFDVLGDSTAKIAISASINKKSIPVYDKDGAVTEVYSDGCYVIPDLAGDMEILYVANDGAFDGNPFAASVKVFEVEPIVNYAISGVLESGAYGVGKSISLYAATASGDIFRSKAETVVSVYKDGKVLPDFDKIKPSGNVVFDSVGEYRIVYSCAGIQQTAAFDMTVVNDKAVFNYSAEIPAVGLEGETLTLPKCTVSYKGESKTATLSVSYPDGGLYGNEVVALQQAGLYRITYSAEFDGVLYEESKSVVVSGKQATFTNSAGGTVTLGARNNRYAAMTGAYLKTNSSGSVFTYSEILNLSDATSEDTILKMYSAASWGGGNGMPTIYLTDVHDPSNVVTIYTKYGYHEYLNVCYAYAPDQTQKSMNGSQESPSGTEYWSPKDGWGTAVFYNQQAMISPAVPYERQAIDIRYDNATKCLYLNQNGSVVLIIDLDADYQEIPWKGFTTGEVYLSFSGVQQAIVTEVYGNDFTVGGYYTDTQAPKITVDTAHWSEETLPVAVVGQPYGVFAANATDNWSANVGVDVRVYYGYGTQNYTELGVKDGCFVPKKTGRYTIEYTAMDTFGNVCVKTVAIDAVKSDAVEEISFELNGEPKDKAFLGAEYDIPAIARASGGVSELEYSILVEEPDGNAVVVEKGFFVPKKVGAHRLVYTVFDYAANETVKSYSFTVEASDDPIFSNLSLPKAIVSGTAYKLPICEAIDYSSDAAGEKVATTVSATLDDSALTIENGVVTPVVAKEGVLKLTYTAKGVSKTFTCKVINPGKEAGFMANYFYVEEGAVTTEATADGILLSVTESDSIVQFLNPVLAAEVIVKLAIPDANKANTDTVTMWLYDAENEAVSVRLDFIKKAGDMQNSYLSINGGSYRTMSGSLLNENLPFGFTYKQESLTVLNLNGNVVGYLNENDPDFKGFSSGKVIVKIGVGEINGGVDLMLTDLNNQLFSDSKSDSIIPEAMLSQNIPLLLDGNQLTIPSMIAQDVLSPNVQVKVVFAMVGGETLYTSETNEAATLTISKAGRYRVNYTVSDGGKTARFTYIVNTREDQAPTLVFQSKIKTEYKAGEKLQLPEYQVSDNETANPTVRIYVYFPNGSMWCLENPEITLDQVGKYKIKFFVYDENYNYTEESFTITVR